MPAQLPPHVEHLLALAQREAARPVPVADPEVIERQQREREQRQIRAVRERVANMAVSMVHTGTPAVVVAHALAVTAQRLLDAEKL